MADIVQIIWLVLPIFIGGGLGAAIGWIMRNKWKTRINLQRKQEREIKDLVTSE